jgi:hypothetical protein
MSAPYMRLITEVQTIIRRDFVLADPTILQPNSSNPLIDGEWLELDASYKLARGTGEGTNANVFPVWTERGRSDTQAILKATVLFLGGYEVETRVYDPTALVVGDELTVQDVTVGGLTKRGVKEGAGGGGRVVVGYVSKVGTDRIRFIHYANFKR